MELKTGDIIQITDQGNKWYPCLLIVDEVRTWGVQAYITIPSSDGEPLGNAYYRIPNGQFVKVGTAEIVVGIA
jgi:hypothetical protein